MFKNLLEYLQASKLLVVNNLQFVRARILNVSPWLSGNLWALYYSVKLIRTKTMIYYNYYSNIAEALEKLNIIVPDFQNLPYIC